MKVEEYCRRDAERTFEFMRAFDQASKRERLWYIRVWRWTQSAFRKLVLKFSRLK